MIIYEVRGKIPYDNSLCLFRTTSKELAELFKNRAEKFASYVSKKKAIYFELEDNILEKVKKSYRIDYTKTTQEQLREINSQIDIEEENFQKLLKESPVEQRAFKHLDSIYLDFESFDIVEVVIQDKLPELFSFNEDVAEDEIEFLKKDFERFCNENISNI